jgi:hypothetical protein
MKEVQGVFLELAPAMLAVASVDDHASQIDRRTLHGSEDAPSGERFCEGFHHDFLGVDRVTEQ